MDHQAGIIRDLLIWLKVIWISLVARQCSGESRLFQVALTENV